MSDTYFCPQDTLARPDEIRRCAERLRSISGILLGHGDDVGAVLNQVALSFSEVISSAVAAQIGNNLSALETAVEGTEYGYGVGSAWADDVETFIAERNALISQWEAAELSDFGVPPPVGLANAEPEMADRMYDQRRLAIGAARQDELHRYEIEAQQLWERFQDRVHEKGRMFREGPTPANLELLVSYLGWGAMTLWPESATTPVTGAQEGAASAATVVAGLDGRASPEDVAEALSTIAMITRRATQGHELTESELAYLEAFYGTIGARILDVPAYLASTSGPMMSDPDAPPTYVPPLPFNGSPELVEALAMAAANGLLVLSRPTSRTNDDNHDGYQRLPTWLRDSLAIEDNDPSKNPYVHFERLVDLGDLLGHSTVEAGTGLSRELADSVGWMINYADSREDSLSADAEDSMRARIALSAPHLLDVVARNDEVCFDLLTGSGMRDAFSPTDYFTDIYAFDWAIDDGAAAASLTDFIPAWATSDDPIAASHAEDAMFHLVQIVTGDASFGQLMDGVGTSGIAAESAVGQVNPAITRSFVAAMAPYMDQFAGPQNDGANPRGVSDLTFETRVRFATLIGTDPACATAMAAAAGTYEQHQLYNYAVSGDAQVSGGNIGRLRGIVEAGMINAGIDAGADHADAAAVAARSRQMGMDIAQGILGGIPAPGFSGVVDTVFAVLNGQADESGVGQSTFEAPSPPRTEDEQRYDTVSSVMAALVASGQIPTMVLPVPFMGPVVEPPTPERLTDDLLRVATAYGYDLTPILDRIESAYGHPDLVDERDN